MKRMTAMILTVVLVLSLAACGGKSQEAPDLTAYYDDFMATLAEDEQPMMMDVTDDQIDMIYPGLSDYELKQSVLKVAAISATPWEFALVECASEDDVEAVKGILQARVDTQVGGGAWYPETIEAWKKAEVLVDGSVVALISAGDSQDDAVTAFKALLK